MRFIENDNALIFMHQGELGRIEAWGKDSLRVRTTRRGEFSNIEWALTEAVEPCKPTISIDDGNGWPFASITNGRLKATVNHAGVMSFYKDGELMLREYHRMYSGTYSRESRCLKMPSRTWKGIIGGDMYSLNLKFESHDGEKIFGMGQYQQRNMDMKGCVLELAQRNSQITVPFAVSSLGYGFLWNNPAVGRVTFGANYTEWIAESTKDMDYWLTVADTPKQIVENYTNTTGRPAVFPEDRMGLWQCKLRYRTQEEVLSVARKYHELGIHIDQIVIDFFHWTRQGEWEFDSKYWPDPKAMVDELHSLGIKVMVSVWPSVDRKSKYFNTMVDRDLLVKTERGTGQTYEFQGDCADIDAFNPETRMFVWDLCYKNYMSHGIDAFWLDCAEPEFGAYDFDHYRYCAGPAMAVSNIFPQMYSRAFWEPMDELRNGPIVNLIRSAWAGSQKYGNVVWSGDVPSTFESFADQLQCGLNMGLAGISWWTTDIGGFMTDDVNDPKFRQLLVRWFQFAVFSAVLRMHGDRGPHNIPRLDDRECGGGYLSTGQPNELWSYGDDCFRIMKAYLDIRLSMHDYIKELYQEAHDNGSPLIRAMFYEFPEDETCWNLQDQYMFGSRYLVAPILHLDEFKRDVYLPAGTWKLTSTGETFDGGRTVTVDAPIEYMPVFERVVVSG